VSLDLGMQYRGLFTDMAVTVGLGKISYQDKSYLILLKRRFGLLFKQQNQIILLVTSVLLLKKKLLRMVL